MGGTEKGEEDTRKDLGLQEGDGLKERRKEQQRGRKHLLENLLFMLIF